MKFKITFPAEMKDTMQKAFENQRAVFRQTDEGRNASGVVLRGFRKSIKTLKGWAIPHGASYEFISDTEAIFEMQTGWDAYMNPKMILKKVREMYCEKESEGKIHVELIEEDEDAAGTTTETQN